MTTMRDELSGFPFPMISRGLKGPLTYVPQDTVTLIKSSIHQIILTIPGERIWNPEFGCRLKLMLFDTLSPNLIEVMTNEVLDAIRRWEPRVIVGPDDISVQASDDIDAQVEIHVNFRVKNPDFTSDPNGSVVVVI